MARAVIDDHAHSRRWRPIRRCRRRCRSSRTISGGRRRPRRARCCAWRRPDPARRRRSSPGSHGSSIRARRPSRSARSPSTSARPRSCGSESPRRSSHWAPASPLGSGSGPSTRSGWRCSGPPACRSRRCWIATRSCERSALSASAAERRDLRHGHLEVQARPRRRPGGDRGRSRGGAVARTYAAYEAEIASTRWPRLR